MQIANRAAWSLSPAGRRSTYADRGDVFLCGGRSTPEYTARVRTTITAIRWFGYVWLTLATIIILIGMVGVLLFQGLWAFWDMMSPFNLVHYTSVMITLAPGMGAMMLADWLAKRADLRVQTLR